MNQHDRNTLATAISEAAIYFGKYDLSKEQITILINTIQKQFKILCSEDVIKVVASIQKYLEDPKNKAFFSPATLKTYFAPELSIDAESNEVASRIREAVKKFGWSNPSASKLMIGSIGWQIVERSGGWQYICENLGLDLNPLVFHAQARELAKSLIEQRQKHIDAPSLEFDEKEQLPIYLKNLPAAKAIE